MCSGHCAGLFQTIRDEGVDLQGRGAVNFLGGLVQTVDDPTNDEIEVHIGKQPNLTDLFSTSNSAPHVTIGGAGKVTGITGNLRFVTAGADVQNSAGVRVIDVASNGIEVHTRLSVNRLVSATGRLAIEENAALAGGLWQLMDFLFTSTQIANLPDTGGVPAIMAAHFTGKHDVSGAVAAAILLAPAVATDTVLTVTSTAGMLAGDTVFINGVLEDTILSLTPTQITLTVGLSNDYGIGASVAAWRAFALGTIAALSFRYFLTTTLAGGTVAEDAPLYFDKGGADTAAVTDSWAMDIKNWPGGIRQRQLDRKNRLAGNLQLFSDTESFGGGVGVLGIRNAGTNPSANPTNGGVLYASAGALVYRGSGGTVTTIAVA